MKLVHYIAIAGLSAMMFGLPAAHADVSMDATAGVDQSGSGDQGVTISDDGGNSDAVAPNCTVGNGGAC